MNKKYDWDNVEAYFFNTDDVTLKDISETFNIPYVTVRRYAASQDWHGRKYRAWLEAKHGISFK